jgi:hypothetical protein
VQDMQDDCLLHRGELIGIGARVAHWTAESSKRDGLGCKSREGEGVTNAQTGNVYGTIGELGLDSAPFCCNLGSI